MDTPEHHFEPDGYLPNPIPLMTAMAMKTKRMLVGADLFRLPDWHPVRLAEDVVLVDILSQGRVLFKAGAGGIFPPISAGLGWEQRRSLSRSAETLQIIKQCWTEDVFDWEGTHYHLTGVRAMPKPVQQPHPPIFMPARNPRAMERNAREGYGATQGAGRWTLEQTDPGADRPWVVAAMAHGVEGRAGAPWQDPPGVPGVGLLQSVLHPRPGTGLGHLP